MKGAGHEARTRTTIVGGLVRVLHHRQFVERLVPLPRHLLQLLLHDVPVGGHDLERIHMQVSPVF